jgi:hypothetical protein
MNTCPSCRGLDDGGLPLSAYRHHDVCECYECQLCQARGSIQEYMDDLLCDHSFVSQYKPVMEQRE